MSADSENAELNIDVVSWFTELSRAINGWLDQAINANASGLDFVISSTIRIERVVDCLIRGIGLKNSNHTITMLAQDNLCTLYQLTPQSFVVTVIGLLKI